MSDPSHDPTPLGRPSWSGLVQLSLVSIPVKAYAAVRTRDSTPCHFFHADCGQRIRYAKHCPVHGEVDPATIVRGVACGPGQHVVLEAAELDALLPVPDRALRLERFLEPAQLDPLLFSGRSLYLLPDGPVAGHAYAVLHQALVQCGRWAVGRVVLGGRRQVVVLRPAAAGLVVQVLHFPEQLRTCPPAARPPLSGAAAELGLAAQLIAAATGDVDWTAYRDEAAQERQALVEAKRPAQPVAAGEPVVLPLLAALEQSLAATQPAADCPTGRRPRSPRPRVRRRA
jgi:DNA end-binding protein Ku